MTAFVGLSRSKIYSIEQLDQCAFAGEQKCTHHLIILFALLLVVLLTEYYLHHSSYVMYLLICMCAHCTGSFIHLSCSAQLQNDHKLVAGIVLVFVCIC